MSDRPATERARQALRTPDLEWAGPLVIGLANDVLALASALEDVEARLAVAEKRLRHNEFHRSSNRRSMRARGKVIKRLNAKIERQREALRSLEPLAPIRLSPLEAKVLLVLEADRDAAVKRAEAAERDNERLLRWKELLARNVAMTREICDDPTMALDFIEGFATDRIGMIVPPDMVDPADMAWAIQRGRELAAEHGWASPEEIAAAIERDAALAVPSEPLTKHPFSGDPWGPCSKCWHPAHHLIHRIAEPPDEETTP